VGIVVFRRPARRRPPPLPSGELLLEAPPELPESVGGGFSMALIYLPMLAGGAAMAFMFMGTGAQPITIVAGAMYGVSMAGMMIGQISRGSSEKKRRLDADRRDYARYLSQVRRKIRRAASQQRQALLWIAPGPDELWSVAMSSRLWERRTGDGDFGAVRVAVGVQRLSVSLITPETKPIEDLEPLSTASLRRFVRAHSSVPELPVSVSIRSFGRILLRGEAEDCAGLARAVLAHLAVFHSPEDLRIVICAAPDRIQDWDWVKWLPHALHPTDTDAAGPVRLFATSLRAVETLLPELAQRPRFGGPASSGSASLPHYLVVVDGVGPQADSPLAATDLDGVTLLDLGQVLPRDTDQTALHLAVSPDQLSRISWDRTGVEVLSPIGRPDMAGVVVVEALARLMAPLRLSVGGDADEVMSRDLGLPQLLGLGDPARLDVAATWRPRPLRDRLRVPIGVGPSGAPVELDIKEAAQDGMGPHGLVVGATGSGKSELLRTLVLGLAATHPSDVLNLVLVDFKGGATFARLEDLPHTSALITNLEDDLSMVDRMRDALDGELNRRQELLRDAGNFANLKDYEAAREAGAALPPLPTLFVVVDEFSELLTAKPDFVDLFITIGRIGRSLGVHLLLASQRLEEGRLRGLDTYLSYRIGLRTFSSLESRVVLGVPDAYELPNAPGHGYLKIDTSTMLRFRAAYVSGACTSTRPGSPQSGATALQSVTPYDLTYHAPPATAPPAGPLPDQRPAQAADPNAETVLEVMTRRLVGKGTPVHKVWLPPLTEPATLGELLPSLAVDPVRGLCPAGWPGLGQLRAPIGLVDRPYHQRRDPLLVDLSGAGGHVAVVGAPQSGKSTVARSLIAALSLTCSPAEVQFYCLDFGGGSLGSLLGLPHVGSVATRMSPELIRRTMAELTGLLERREKLFAERRIDSMAAYRRMKREGRIADDPFGDVVLVVDGWGVLRSDFEALELEVTALAARGLGYGVHVVITAQRWMEVRAALKDLIGTRVELRLGDPSESDVDRRSAMNVPHGHPGRGLTADRMHLLSALPRLDADHAPDTLIDGVADLVAQISQAWTGARAPGVRLLPTDLPFTALPVPLPAPTGSDRATGGQPWQLPIGIDEDALAPVFLDLRTDPHLVVFGDGRCGKSNLLKLICRAVADRYTPEQAKIILLDYRHSLLDVASLPHTLAHGFASNHAAPIVANVTAGLNKRLPPSDITPDQLRTQDWWHGPELFLVVDDYDLVATGHNNPLAPLLDLLPLARDIGLHLIVARSAGGAGRAMFEPVIQRLREAGSPALIMSGTRDEGALFGNVKPEPLPPGRGRLVTRRGVRLIQTAHLTLAASSR
jgi:S-DNA-T family DNA segregation ATPase FtsK/SpoIIIE